MKGLIVSLVGRTKVPTKVPTKGQGHLLSCLWTAKKDQFVWSGTKIQLQLTKIDVLVSLFGQVATDNILKIHQGFDHRSDCYSICTWTFGTLSPHSLVIPQNPTFCHIKANSVAQYSCITSVDRFDSELRVDAQLAQSECWQIMPKKFNWQTQIFALSD